jgi:hypothetical protein
VLPRLDQRLWSGRRPSERPVKQVMPRGVFMLRAARSITFALGSWVVGRDLSRGWTAPYEMTPASYKKCYAADGVGGGSGILYKQH